MTLTSYVIYALGAVVTLLVMLLVARPGLIEGRGGKALGFLALFAGPVLLSIGGGYHHLETSKSTQFCLSCHAMEPYGQSLHYKDTEYLPAVHFQNHLIPEDRACFTCHTTYTMYGDLQAKLRGLQHLYVHYLKGAPEKLALYGKYNNRECLHCHQGARRFMEESSHRKEIEKLVSNETSCLSCHEWVHAIDEQGDLELWTEEKGHE